MSRFLEKQRGKQPEKKVEITGSASSIFTLLINENSLALVLWGSSKLKHNQLAAILLQPLSGINEKSLLIISFVLAFYGGK